MPEKTPRPESSSATGSQSPANQTALEYIQQAIHGLRFGEVTVTVQDGAIVQVERTEKKRFDRVGKHRLDSRG